jgi:hypothetical protein
MENGVNGQTRPLLPLKADETVLSIEFTGLWGVGNHVASSDLPESSPHPRPFHNNKFIFRQSSEML